MFVLSKNYLRACGDDIAAGSEHIADPDRFLIVSVGARLQGTWPPSPSRLTPACRRNSAGPGGRLTLV